MEKERGKILFILTRICVMCYAVTTFQQSPIWGVKPVCLSWYSTNLSENIWISVYQNRCILYLEVLITGLIGEGLRRLIGIYVSQGLGHWISVTLSKLYFNQHWWNIRKQVIVKKKPSQTVGHVQEFHITLKIVFIFKVLKG